MDINKTNVKPEIDYLVSHYIREYDIQKANISILYSLNVIDNNLYSFLYNAPRDIRQVYIGNMIKNDKKIYDILHQGIIDARNLLITKNNLTELDILTIKNDAIFIIDKELQYTSFGNINFLCKNKYTSFINIEPLEIYYFYDMIYDKEVIDIKGINDDTLETYHHDTWIPFICQLLYLLNNSNIENAIEYYNNFYIRYCSKSLDIEFYREFNSDSRFITVPICGKRYATQGAGDMSMIDISYNKNLLHKIYKILLNIYFTKQ